MKKILTILSTVSVLALPFATSALTVRTDRSNSTGGVTVTEGGAAVTGNESSSVNVSNVISGTRGQVQVTTEKDGVTTTETHTINGNDSVQVITPPPASQNSDSTGRTPRTDRGVVAVQGNTSDMSVNSVTQASVSTGSTHTSVTSVSRGGNVTSILKSQAAKANSVASSKLAIAGAAHGLNNHVSSPVIVNTLQLNNSADMSSSISSFISRLLSAFGLSA